MGSAHAQSFFEKLFGLAPTRSAPVAPQREALPPPFTRTMSPLTRSEQTRDTSISDDAENRRRPTGRFRAVCVRLCDGYYWPMNDHASSQTLHEMADRCKSTCGTEARLFYTEREEATDPASMTDLSGRRYDALRTAFVYREKLISGCSCKPAPWSAAEQSRHAGYALAALRAEQARVAAIAAEAARKDAENNRIAEAKAAKEAKPAEVAAIGTGGGVSVLAAAESDVTDQHGMRLSDESYIEPTSAGAAPTIAGVGRGDGMRTRTIRVSQRPFEPRPRATRAVAERVRPQRVAASSQGSGFGLFGGGKSKYVWPGDR